MLKYNASSIKLTGESNPAITTSIKLNKMHPDCEIIFCNGGDRNNSNSPEQSIKGIKNVFGVGGEDKKNSSSWILKKYEDT